MKTSALTLLMALLGAFALQASPDSMANVRLDSLMKNDTLINAPAMKAETKTDSGQTI